MVSDSVRPYGVWPARFLCPWDFAGKNTGVGCHFLLQGIFPAGIEPTPSASPALQADSLPLSPWGSPIPPFTSVHSPLLRDLNENLRFPVCLGNPSFLWGIPTFGHSGPSSSSAPDSPIPTQPMFLDTDVLAGWWGEILMAPKGCF